MKNAMSELNELVAIIRKELEARMATAARDIAKTASADFERKLNQRIPEITASVVLQMVTNKWFMDVMNNQIKITIDLNRDQKLE